MESLRNKLGAAVAGGVLLLGGAAGAYALTGAAGAQDSNSTTATTVVPSSDAGAPAANGQAAPQAPPDQSGTQQAPADQSGTQQGQPPQGQPPAGQQGQPPQGAPSGPHSANGITETVLTGSDAEKVTAAAQEKVSGGTIDRVETDAEGAAFEAHVTKADGSKVTVKLDASFNVTSVEDGMR